MSTQSIVLEGGVYGLHMLTNRNHPSYSLFALCCTGIYISGLTDKERLSIRERQSSYRMGEENGIHGGMPTHPWKTSLHLGAKR